MKSLLLMAVTFVTLGFSSQSLAVDPDFCMASSGGTVATSAGTGEICGDNTSGAQCADLSCRAWAIRLTSCPTGYGFRGYTITDKLCCHKTSGPCLLTEQTENQEEVVTTKDAEALEQAFAPRSASYWGYINNVARSPGAGRTAQAPAKLDICLGESVVSGLGDNSSCYSSCASGSNGYCTNSGYNDGGYTAYSVCKDRCDCLFGGNCESL